MSNNITDLDGSKHAERKAEQSAEQHLAWMRRRALRDITQQAESLRYSLEQVKKDVDAALATMDQGKNKPSGVGWGFGPIGHQAPFDLAQRSERLNIALNLAKELECTDAEIERAYMLGAIDADAKFELAMREHAERQVGEQANA